MASRITTRAGATLGAIIGLVAAACIIQAATAQDKGAQPPKPDTATQACINCHEQKRIAVDSVRQWASSRHAEARVGCLACHQAEPDDPDKWKHQGFLVTHVPSPRDCAPCHAKEVREFTASHHAKAAQFIGSLDNILGEVVEGGPAANLGCKQCHGSVVKVDAQGVPVAGTWPNTGVGRVNPDGSKGSCTACHTRHMFSKQQAREPLNCARCHMGPDHPQREIYEESKHGIMFYAWREKMALDADEWIVGKTYTAAPTCATCHMSATPTQPVSHDVGRRMAWTLRPVISKRQEDWQNKRSRMQAVCHECHGPTWVGNYFTMYDDAVQLYNDKFASPAEAIMGRLRKAGKITATPFDDHIEWTFFELWHHEGRRARMGAAMMGPDFTQWHGFYEVSKHFYNEFLPQAEELLPGVADSTLAMDEHKWKGGMSPEDIRKMLDFYEKRYGQTGQ
ncbi:MAG: multiheme c-type cytochrome [Armatimonadota bacterium]